MRHKKDTVIHSWGYKTAVWHYLTSFIRHFIHTKLYYDYIENVNLHEKSHHREIKSKKNQKIKFYINLREKIAINTKKLENKKCKKWMKSKKRRSSWKLLQKENIQKKMSMIKLWWSARSKNNIARIVLFLFFFQQIFRTRYRALQR